MQYAFDTGNRLRNVAGEEGGYAYDAWGRRVAQTDTTGTIYSFYDRGGQLIYQRDRMGGTHDYLYLGGKLVAIRDYDTQGIARTMRYQHTDALGSVIRQTDKTGQEIANTDVVYDAWGGMHGVIPQDGPGYTGHVQDANTHLVYMQQRYYDPSVGRFLSMDPVDASGTDGANLDRYWYAKDNPYRYTDPFGLFKCSASASAADCKTITSKMNGAIKLIQRAADNLSDSAKFTNRIAGGKLNSLVKFLKSDNVVVSLGGSKGGEPGGTTPGPAGSPVQVRFDFKHMGDIIRSSQYKSNTQNEIAASVAHEGQHAEDVFAGKMSANTNTYLGYYVSETRAFTTQSDVNRGLGTASAWGLWTPEGSAPGVDQAAQRGAWYDCSSNSGCDWNN